MHLMRVSPHGNTECPGEPKVCQLQVVAFIDEKILWFEVAMKNTMRVTIKEARG
jgi:hypothetical protein